MEQASFHVHGSLPVCQNESGRMTRFHRRALRWRVVYFRPRGVRDCGTWSSQLPTFGDGGAMFVRRISRSAAMLSAADMARSVPALFMFMTSWLDRFFVTRRIRVLNDVIIILFAPWFIYANVHARLKVFTLTFAVVEFCKSVNCIILFTLIPWNSNA